MVCVRGRVCVCVRERERERERERRCRKPPAPKQKKKGVNVVQEIKWFECEARLVIFTWTSSKQTEQTKQKYSINTHTHIITYKFGNFWCVNGTDTYW